MTVTLSASDAFSGVDHTYYTVDGGADTTYTAPFEIAADGAHDIEYYSIDVAGQGRYPTPGRLALATGGDYLYNNHDFVTPLRAIQQENNGYYLLSYRSSHPAGASGFQRIAVTTINPEFQVRARSGYRFGER